MKTIHLLLFIFLFSFGYSQSQTFLWVKHNSHPFQANPDFGIVSSIADGSGNFTIGTIYNFKLIYNINFYGDVVIRKYNASGTEVLTKVMTGKAAITGIKTDASGNIYIRGNFMDTLIIDQSNILINTGSGFNINYFLLKLNSSGVVLWKKNINVLYGQDKVLSEMNIRGNFLYAGIQNFTQGTIKKFDLNGNEQLSIPLNQIRVISGIDADSHGNIYSSGSCSLGNITFGGLTVNCPFPYSQYFAKFSSSGSGVWAKFVEDATFENPRLVCDADGNCYTAGDLNGSFWFGNLHSIGPQWVYDFFVAKLDSSGTFLWLREIPLGNTSGDASVGNANSIFLDNLNNVYVTGFQRGTINWGSATTVSAGANDVLVLKYNSNGTLVWGRTAGGTMGESGDAISLDNSNNIYLSGNFDHSSVFDTITVIGSGLLNSYAAKLTNPAITGIVKNQNYPNSFSLINYPNPFNPSTKIKFDIPSEGIANDVPVKIVIYDVLGRLVETIVNQNMKPGSYEINWNANGYSSGLYFYRLTAENISITNKMMLLK